MAKENLTLQQALRVNYREDEITKFAIILEYVVLDFLNRFMDVALAKWVHNAIGSSDYSLKNKCKSIRFEKIIIDYILFAIIYKTFPLCLKKRTRKIQAKVQKITYPVPWEIQYAINFINISVSQTSSFP